MSADLTLAVSRAAVALGDLARFEVPLAPLTTYRVGGAARLFVRAESVDDLRTVAVAIERSNLPVLLVGRGSNLLVADSGFDGIAVSLGAFAEQVDIPDPAIGHDGPELIVRAGAAVSLPVLARRCAAAGMVGLEWAVGVPGSVGGAVRMNAGGHGSDIAATLRSADILDLRDPGDGVPKTCDAAQLGLRFRGSDLTDDHVVTAALFDVARGDKDEAERELSEIVRWRREHQPGGQNAGSVFVNPIPGQLAAGQLIDELGLRGFRIGTAEVSTKHANFIQADPEGQAGDVHALIEHVRARVLAASGVLLRSEIRLVGFDVDASSSEPTPEDGQR